MNAFIDGARPKMNARQFEAANNQMATAQITIVLMILAIGALYIAVRVMAPDIQIEPIIEN